MLAPGARWSYEQEASVIPRDLRLRAQLLTKTTARGARRAVLVMALAVVSLSPSAAISAQAQADVQTSTPSDVYSTVDMANYDPSDSASGGVGLSFLRAYDNLTTRVGPLGPGWVHSYDMHLSYVGETKNIILTGPQGRTNRYTSYPGGRYDPEGDVAS